MCKNKILFGLGNWNNNLTKLSKLMLKAVSTPIKFSIQLKSVIGLHTWTNLIGYNVLCVDLYNSVLDDYIFWLLHVVSTTSDCISSHHSLCLHHEVNQFKQSSQ